MKLFEGFHSNVPFFVMAQQSIGHQGLLVVTPARSHPNAPHSVGFISTSDQLDAETSTTQNTQYSQEKGNHAARGIRAWISRSMRPLESAIFYSDLIFLNRFSKTPQIKISWNLVQREPSCSKPTDGRTDITKIIVACRDFQKSPNKGNEF